MVLSPNTFLTEKNRLADLLGLKLWVEPAQEEEEELPDLSGVGSLQLQPLQVLLLKHTQRSLSVLERHLRYSDTEMST
jgi:hypothetical protein